MATFLMYGNYSSRALQEMSVQRTSKAVDLIRRLGGEVEAMYAALGQHDLVFVLSMPGIDEAVKASVALTKLTGIAFSTSPAVSVEHFDKLMSEI
ncbi:MAG: GYD domain-containing protein [Pirellulales bacterium]|nr:GYD domain-containing protein [Pirellulales bacterium]